MLSQRRSIPKQEGQRLNLIWRRSGQHFGPVDERLTIWTIIGRTRLKSSAGLSCFSCHEGGQMTTNSGAPIANATEEVRAEMSQPIIVDLGRQKSTKRKDLKAGEGELWDD